MKISVQSGGVTENLGVEKGYEAIKRAGFEAIDWNLDHAWNISDVRHGLFMGCIFEQSLEAVIAHFAPELEVIRKNGLSITQAHAPFPSYVKDHPGLLNYAIGIYKRNIEYCSYIGCKNLVIHGVSYSLGDDINTPETIDSLNKKLYTSLIPVLLKNNVTVCLENLFTGVGGISVQGHCSDAYKAAQEIDALNAEAGKEVFGLCFDTGHANLLRYDMRAVLPVYGKRIKALHIHDNSGEKDMHRAPMTGTINWKYFCETLKKIGYDGDLSFETFAQMNAAAAFGTEMLEPWLTLICKTGEAFRDEILSIER